MHERSDQRGGAPQGGTAGAATAEQLLMLRAAAAGVRRVACALLVEVDGSAPLPPGAAMLVADDGTIEGSITGGCVEAAAAQEALDVLAGGPPQSVVYGVSDELAGTAGLTCGGTVRVFVHALARDGAAAVAEALDAAAAGRPAAVATLLDGRAAGAKLAIADGVAHGSLGGTARLDRAVERDAVGLLAQGATAVRRYGADGTTLGAELRVHVHAFAPAPSLVLVGAVDFSAALAPLARELGWAVTICDPRERFVRAARFSRAAEVVVGWPEQALAARRLGPRDAVVVLSHDPRIDLPALRAALASGAGYVGALGSRRTTADRARRMRAAGLSDAAIARVRAPCGLDIGGRTAAETAVAILAEIVAVRSGRAGAPLRDTHGPLHASP